MLQVQYATKELIPSFYKTIDQVAKEKIYIELVEAPPFESTLTFQGGLIDKGLPAYYALDTENPSGQEVVGWVDVNVSANPRHSHKGNLGMGLLEKYRGQGLGSKLMAAALEKAEAIGLDKVELTVYTTNLPAIALYKKFGFVKEGLSRNYRKLGRQVFDVFYMAKFFR